MITYVHKSHVSKIKACSQQHYYDNVINAKPEYEDEKSMAGKAFHRFAHEIYISKLPNKWNEPAYWCQFFIDEIKKYKEEAIANDIEIESPADMKIEEYMEMICEFLKQPYNRNAMPILLETAFRFSITRNVSTKQSYKKLNKIVYWFEGTIDQLLKIRTKDIAFCVNRWESLPPTEYVYIHRDIKTGDKKVMSEFTLLTNEDLIWYSYGLAHGLFNTRNDWSTASPISNVGPFIPFAHALYYTRDHLRYKRGSKDGTKKAGDYRGDGMYFIKRDVKDLRLMEEQLILWHKKVNSELYTRDAAGTAFCEYCKHQSKCLHELKIGELHG